MNYVEKLAQEIRRQRGDDYGDSPTFANECAIIAMAAIAGLAERGGAKLVDRTSTACMDASVAGMGPINGHAEAEAIWAGMFDAAPAVPEE